jgi:2-polyprenyl-3-methyl-5-hydroxy-6-metoxy-1,4-benzoquinol methylase
VLADHDDPATAANPWAARWEARYRAGESLFGTAPNAFLAARSGLFRPGMRALCPGEGEGRNALFLAGLGLSVTAVDFAPTALARADARAREAGLDVTTIVADLALWSWPEAAFDLVALIFVQLDAGERVAVHRGAARALAPAGLLVLEAFARGPARDCGPRGEASRYDAAMLREDFAGLEIVSLTEETTLLAEGAGHRGAASVVRLVARAPAQGRRREEASSASASA